MFIFLKIAVLYHTGFSLSLSLLPLSDLSTQVCALCGIFSAFDSLI